MASAVLTIPEEIKSELKRFSWVNWSEFAREELIKQEERLNAWAEVEKILSKSELTEEQAMKLAEEMKESVAKKYQELFKRKR